MKPVVWSIAGSDPSGGAGIQADLKTLDHLGVHCCAIITALTAQNNKGITQLNTVSPDVLRSQINTLNQSLPPKAIKIGMIGSIPLIEVIIDFLKTYDGVVILDPVITSSSGVLLCDGDKHAYVAALKTMLPYITMITPNIPELQEIPDPLSLGVKHVLIKGGHLTPTTYCSDYYSTHSESFWLSTKRYGDKQCRGTGCTLASAIAACCALNYTMKDAVVIAKMYVSQSIRCATALQDDSHQLTHAGWPESECDLPYLTAQPFTELPPAYLNCGDDALGLYPIVDSVCWIQKLIPTGITTLQLRIKNKNSDTLEQDIIDSIALTKKHAIRLFINDHWELALKHHAYGVHLGQGDLTDTNAAALRDAGIRLGISTHCYYEVARAHALRPSYIACGPIFPTTSKVMPFLPQGIDALKRWRRTLNYPLVAIGGIHKSNIDQVSNTGVDGIAMISAIQEVILK